MILAHADVDLAMNAGPTLGAHAFKPADLVPARGAVQTRIRGTVVDVDLARRSGVAFATVTDESVVQVDATIRSNGAARVAETLVQFRLALQPDEARPAPADEPLQLVHAGPSVLARIGGTVVDSVLTLFARVAWLAGARVPVDLIDTLAAVPARFAGTFVYVRLACRAGPSRMTDALVAEQIVHAYPVQAWVARAQVYLLVAPFASESWWAVAAEVGYQISAVSP